MTNKIEKILNISYISLMIMIYFIIMIFQKINYYAKNDFIFSNIFVFVFIFCIVGISIIIRKKYKNKTMKIKSYIIASLVIFAILFLLQLVLSYNSYFFTGWDAGVIRMNVEEFILNKKILSVDYYTRCPNNFLLTVLLILLRKIPFVGSHYFFTIAINCLLVSICGILCNLTIARITKKL